MWASHPPYSSAGNGFTRPRSPRSGRRATAHRSRSCWRCFILANRQALSSAEADPSEIFLSAFIFDGEKRTEGLVEILSAGGEDAVAVDDDAGMVLKNGRHGPAKTVAAGADLARNDGDSTRGSSLGTAEMAETPLRTVLPVAVQREDHRKPGMAVENGVLPRVEDNLAVGGKFAGGGDPGAGGAVQRDRVDAAGEPVEGTPGLADVKDLPGQEGDVPEIGIDQATGNGRTPRFLYRPQDCLRIAEGPRRKLRRGYQRPVDVLDRLRECGLPPRIHPPLADIREAIGEEFDESGETDGTEGDEGLLRAHRSERDDPPPRNDDAFALLQGGDDLPRGEQRRNGKVVEEGPGFRIFREDRPVGIPGEEIDDRPVGLGGPAEKKRLDVEPREDLLEDAARRVVPVPDDLGVDGAHQRRSCLRISRRDQFPCVFMDQLFHVIPSSSAFARVGIPFLSRPRMA